MFIVKYFNRTTKIPIFIQRAMDTKLFIFRSLYESFTHLWTTCFWVPLLRAFDISSINCHSNFGTIWIIVRTKSSSRSLLSSLDHTVYEKQRCITEWKKDQLPAGMRIVFGQTFHSSSIRPDETKTNATKNYCETFYLLVVPLFP